MGVEMLFIGGIILSILLNLLIVIAIFSKGNNINYMDIIMISLSVSDILQAAVGYMMEVHAFTRSRESIRTIIVPLNGTTSSSLTIILPTSSYSVSQTILILSLFLKNEK